MISYQQARKTSKGNKNRTWPSEAGKNRLDPECWPVLEPSFSIAPKDKIFTIGSCFAREIERVISMIDVDLPLLRPEFGFQGHAERQIVNKFTPPSVLQEILWAKKIFTRDDTLRESDVEDLFFQCPDGKVIDLHLAAYEKCTLEFAFERRRNIYAVYREVFSANLVIITLGFIECWFDKKTGLYIERAPAGDMLRESDRFAFDRMDYSRALKCVEQTIAAFDGISEPNFLITASPVPLWTTFTKDDVIVANAYSKSVLRAVAGAVSDQHATVDYFPSYENATVSNRSAVWTADRRHVNTKFVSKIVSKVISAYASDGLSTDLALLSLAVSITENIASGEDKAALRTYEKMGEDALTFPSTMFHLSLANLFARLRFGGKTKTHFEMALAAPDVHPARLYALQSTLHEAGYSALAAKAGSRAAEILSGNSDLASRIAGSLISKRQFPAAEKLLSDAIGADKDHPKLAKQLKRMNSLRT